MEEERVYEIDITKKYILTIPSYMVNGAQTMERISAKLSEWIKSDAPFLVLPEGIKLVKVEDVNVQENH